MFTASPPQLISECKLLPGRLWFVLLADVSPGPGTGPTHSRCPVNPARISLHPWLWLGAGIPRQVQPLVPTNHPRTHRLCQSWLSKPKPASRMGGEVRQEDPARPRAERGSHSPRSSGQHPIPPASPGRDTAPSEVRGRVLRTPGSELSLL